MSTDDAARFQREDLDEPYPPLSPLADSIILTEDTPPPGFTHGRSVSTTDGDVARVVAVLVLSGALSLRGLTRLADRADAAGFPAIAAPIRRAQRVLTRDYGI